MTNGLDLDYTTKNKSEGKGGIDCPSCGDKIDISLDSLLSSMSFRCQKPGCHTVLRIDHGASREALGYARKLRLDLQKVQQN